MIRDGRSRGLGGIHPPPVRSIREANAAIAALWRLVFGPDGPQSGGASGKTTTISTTGNIIAARAFARETPTPPPTPVSEFERVAAARIFARETPAVPSPPPSEFDRVVATQAFSRHPETRRTSADDVETVITLAVFSR